MTYITNKDPYLEIARGNVSGVSHINKFGENPGVTADTLEDIWDGTGTYTFPSTATITHIRAAVDSAATRGKTIEVQGLNSSWAPVTQTKDTDGTTSTVEVALDTALLRVFRMRVLEDTVMDQNIWCGATGMAAGTAKAIIQAGNNQTLMAIYTIPANKTGYLTGYYASMYPDAVRAPEAVEFKLWVSDRANSYERQIKHQISLPADGAPFNYDFAPYLKITEKSDVILSALPIDQDCHSNGGVDIILVDN
jgi:hypothetical protein